MMRLFRFSLLFFVLASLFFLASCASESTIPLEIAGSESPSVVLASSGGVQTFFVEVADTPQLRERGLMFRDFLADDTGMLFVFNESQTRAFWMKNTYIPLTMLFFDADGVLVRAVDASPCTSDPCPPYSSGLPAQYVLEVAQGAIADALFVDANGAQLRIMNLEDFQ